MSELAVVVELCEEVFSLSTVLVLLSFFSFSPPSPLPPPLFSSPSFSPPSFPPPPPSPLIAGGPLSGGAPQSPEMQGRLKVGNPGSLNKTEDTVGKFQIPIPPTTGITEELSVVQVLPVKLPICEVEMSGAAVTTELTFCVVDHSLLIVEAATAVVDRGSLDALELFGVGVAVGRSDADCSLCVDVFVALVNSAHMLVPFDAVEVVISEMFAAGDEIAGVSINVVCVFDLVSL